MRPSATKNHSVVGLGLPQNGAKAQQRTTVIISSNQTETRLRIDWVGTENFGNI
jgi:hypothetical protein